MSIPRRSQVLQALKTLIDGTGYFATVERNHHNPLTADPLPAALIYPENELLEDGTDDEIKKRFFINVVLVDEAGDDKADQIELAVYKIEEIIEVNDSINGTASEAKVPEVNWSVVEGRTLAVVTIECDYQRPRGQAGQ